MEKRILRLKNGNFIRIMKVVYLRSNRHTRCIHLIYVHHFFNFHLISNLTDIPSYDPAYDAAILILKEPVDFSKITNARPAQLPDKDEDCSLFGKDMDTSGCGQYNKTAPSPDKLWTVKQQCLDPTGCTYLFHDDIMLCVGDQEKPKNSACYGDSGGRYSIYI